MPPSGSCLSVCADCVFFSFLITAFQEEERGHSQWRGSHVWESSGGLLPQLPSNSECLFCWSHSQDPLEGYFNSHSCVLVAIVVQLVFRPAGLRRVYSPLECSERLCMYCCRKESLPETWLRCFSQRTPSFSLPQHKSSENYFPKVSAVYFKSFNISAVPATRSSRTKRKYIHPALPFFFHFRTQPTNWWSYTHTWSSGEVCGVLEEECQLHTTGQFIKNMYTEVCF